MTTKHYGYKHRFRSEEILVKHKACLLYTSDAADE